MFDRLRKFFSSKQKGQSMIFLAISAPILCACVGAAIDFGWLYLNQSRLQSAADAAATAGAKTLLLSEQPLSDYSYTNLVANTDPGLIEMKENKVISSRSKNNGTVSKPRSGDSVAQVYATYNLQSWLGSEKTKLVYNDTDTVGVDSNGYENIKFESVLYGHNTEDYEALYYTVTLTTELEHLFGTIMDAFGFEKLPSKATAAVKITHVAERTNVDTDSAYPHGPTLYQQMKAKEAAETFPHWEEIGRTKGADGKNLNGNDRSVLTGGSYYQKGNLYRTEVSHLNGYGLNTGNSTDSRMVHNSKNVQTTLDDLFIDFEPDISGGDWEGDTDLASGLSKAWQLNEGNGASKYYRIHYPLMIETIYPVRAGHEPPDSLYAFIEQEPIRQTVIFSDGSKGTRSNMSSVHQIIINNNIANTNASTDRPWIIFYEGPEIPSQTQRPKLYDDDGDYIGTRPFLPIIINLYANFRGVVFAPNNPVIINGNGYKMEGFVVGREFRRLKTAADFVSEGYSLLYYNGEKVYAKQNGALVKFTNSSVSTTTSSTVPSGYFAIKAKINNVWIMCYLKNGQYYTNPSNTSQFDAQINDNGTTRYAYFKDMIVPVTKLSGANYALADNGNKYYMSVTTEYSATSNGSVSYTQKVNEMYVSGTSYTYEETYMNTSGKVKTKTTTMAIGDVAWMPISTVSASKDSTTGKYTETPGDIDSFVSDDALRYDYVSIFNLSQNSTYNSFLNVGLVNYTYLSKNEASSTTSSAKSHDMFFTTARSKHID